MRFYLRDSWGSEPHPRPHLLAAMVGGVGGVGGGNVSLAPLHSDSPTASPKGVFLQKFLLVCVSVDSSWGCVVSRGCLNTRPANSTSSFSSLLVLFFLRVALSVFRISRVPVAFLCPSLFFFLSRGILTVYQNADYFHDRT